MNVKELRDALAGIDDTLEVEVDECGGSPTYAGIASVCPGRMVFQIAFDIGPGMPWRRCPLCGELLGAEEGHDCRAAGVTPHPAIVALLTPAGQEGALEKAAARPCPHCGYAGARTRLLAGRILCGQCVRLM